MTIFRYGTKYVVYIHLFSMTLVQKINLIQCMFSINLASYHFVIIQTYIQKDILEQNVVKCSFCLSTDQHKLGLTSFKFDRNLHRKYHNLWIFNICSNIYHTFVKMAKIHTPRTRRLKLIRLTHMYVQHDSFPPENSTVSIETQELGASFFYFLGKRIDKA